MNLLMITGDRTLAEGKKSAFYNTLEEFHKYWDRIDIICPKTEFPMSDVRNFFGNVFIHPSPWPLVAQPFWILKKGKQIYAEQKFDLMTVHEYPPFYNGIRARLLWGWIQVPYILEIHHIPGFPKAAGPKERFYKNLMRFFIRADSAKAKAVRAVNKKQVPDFLIKAGVPKDKIVYIPSFYIDLDVFRPLAVEKKYDLVFAARLEKNKGIRSLLEAVKFSIFNFQFPMKLLIIGSGPLKQELVRFVEQNDLRDSVFFSGWLETLNNVAQAYNSAKIFINPSLNEGGPRVTLEAMACGLPIITTKVGLMPDIIHDDENGLFIDWTLNDMAEKIISLLKNKELQNKFSEAGLELVKQFERNAAIKNYAEQLQKLV